MSGGNYFVLLLFSSLLVCGLAQYYGYPSYPYGYGGGVPSYYPANQGYYQPSPCRPSCGNVQRTSHCQHLPCYAQPSYYSPYVMPYPYYNSRTSVNPYASFYANQRKTSDPYAHIPVEIIDDQSVLSYRKPLNVNKKDPYANVPVEIIDDDGYGDFWKHIPRLPTNNRTSQSNYTVSQGAVTTNTVSQNKPISAVISRSFQPLQAKPKVTIDFLNGKTVNASGTSTVIKEEKVESSIEVTTIETDEVTEAEDENVKPVKSWGLFN